MEAAQKTFDTLNETLAEAKPGMVKKLRARMDALDAEITQNARQPWLKN